MLDLKNRVLYIHIPKCAGQAIERYFMDVRGLDWLDRGALGLHRNPKAAGLSRANDHLTLRHYEDFVFGGPIPSDIRIFTVVRNPTDRFWSEMRYRFHGRLPPQAVIRAAELAPEALRDLRDHLRPQADYVEGVSSDRVRVLRLEQLDDDFASMVEEWALPGTGELPRINVSTTRRYRWRRSASLDRWVTERYAGDFERFGYATTS